VKGYFDTSYLVALYVPNDHTAAALRHRARTGHHPLQFTPLHRLELRTTVRQCAYGALIKEADARRILRHIEQDLDDGTLIHQPLDWIASLRQTELIAERQAWGKRCRSLDLWHVAAAVETAAELFVTFDNDQFALAAAEGFRVEMPR
jgi:hypothetical protein